MTNYGLSLIEVVLAVAITSVAVLSAAGLQSTGFRANRAAQVNAQLAHAATSELEMQKGLERTETSSTSLSCLTHLPSSEMSCALSVYPCELTGGALYCRNGSVSEPVAYQLEVHMAGFKQALRLQTVVLP